MKVLCLPRYSRLGASSRLRHYQYIPHLREAGFDVTSVPLLTDEYIEALYAGEKVNLAAILKAYLSRISMLLRKYRYDVLWIEKEAFPWLPSWFEEMVLGGGIPYVIDYDDAIYHRYDMHPSQVVRICLSNKIDKIMRRASLVTCGNEYLAERARRAGAKRVEILPTVVDLSRYPLQEQLEESLSDHVPVIGWIGTPATSHYLELVRLPLREVCKGGKARIRLIGARDPKWSDLPYEVVSWSESQEVLLLHTIDIGIMPLPDMPWERGKCGYKLIQYMACGKPVVASPVGINRQIVVDGINGFLAESPEQWVQALVRLRDDAMLRQRMGSAGRAHVEQRYSLQVSTPRVADLLRTAASNKA